MTRLKIFFQKSLLRRIFLYFSAAGLLMLAALFVISTQNFSILALTLFLSLCCTFGLVWFLISHPLQAVLEQIRSLLTGRSYRKIFTRRIDEIGVIAHFFNEVTKNFERVSGQIREGKRMLSELQIASEIQKEILPLQSPQIPGLDIVAKTRPAVELGGDNFDFITEKDNTYIYIGDVTGHGVPAALIMIMVHTLIHTFVEIYENAYQVVVQTNRRLKTRIKSTMFMTMLMLRWNNTTQKMTYVGAGHEHLLIYRAAKGECEVKMSGGIALGMVADNSKIIKELDLQLGKGDIIVLYSDGIIEARNMAGEMFGLERLKKAVEIYAPQYSSEGIVHHIARDFSRFVEEHIQEDDVTLIAVRYTGTESQNEASVSESTRWIDETLTQ
jgi:serine phosphatase RsbU (regulator of sigma subunit)